MLLAVEDLHLVPLAQFLESGRELNRVGWPPRASRNCGWADHHQM